MSDQTPPPASEPTDARPTLSLDELKRFVGDDPEFIQEFLGEFRKSARTHAESLNAAMAVGDLARVSMVAHTLKSTARTAGAAPLGDILAELEIAANEQDKPKVDRYFGAFLAELPRVERRLAELLAVR